MMLRMFLVVPLILLITMGLTFQTQTSPRLLKMAPVIISRSPYPQKGDLWVFLDAIGIRESNNNYGVTNRWGFMGKYQFGITTLKGLGNQYQVSQRHFLNNPELQDSAMIEYLRRNRLYLRDVISRYDGKWYRGMYITESGILAGAHLVGPVGVMAYFNPRSVSYRPILEDANGTHVRDYIKEFSGYSLVMLN